MWENLIATLIAAAITGPSGYFLSKWFAKEKYLPESIGAPRDENYEFLQGEWYLYHFTRDTKLSNDTCLAFSKITLKVNRNAIVTGSEEVQVDYRKALKYMLRGEARAGQLYFTCICLQDQSEVYSMMFCNLLDDDLVGIMIAKDYQRNLYCSPALISKSRKTHDSALEILNGADINLYSKITLSAHTN